MEFYGAIEGFPGATTSLGRHTAVAGGARPAPRVRCLLLAAASSLACPGCNTAACVLAAVSSYDVCVLSRLQQVMLLAAATCVVSSTHRIGPEAGLVCMRRDLLKDCVDLCHQFSQSFAVSMPRRTGGRETAGERARRQRLLLRSCAGPADRRLALPPDARRCRCRASPQR